MSATFTLYVVNEDKLPAKLEGLSDMEKYNRLVAAVEAEGARWAVLELRTEDFAAALESIDRRIGDTGFLPVFAFNNSPHNVLGNYGEGPCFGYFNPIQVKDLHACVQALSPETLEDDDVGENILDEVFYAFESVAAEASKRGYALAVIHS